MSVSKCMSREIDLTGGRAVITEQPPMVEVPPPARRTPVGRILFTLEWNLAKAEEEAERIHNEPIRSQLQSVRRELMETIADLLSDNRTK